MFAQSRSPIMPMFFMGILICIVLGFFAPTVGEIISSIDINPDYESHIDQILDSYISTESHGNLKHADVYSAVVNACKSPQYQLWLRPSKRVDVCIVKELGFGFRVLKQIAGNKNNKVWSERTAYIREEIKSYQDLVEFAKKNNIVLKELQNGTWIDVSY